MMKTAAILLAGGIGSRMQSTIPKQFLLLKEQPIALYSFQILKSHPAIFEIVVVCSPEFRSIFPLETLFALPGERRQDSVYNGLKQVSKECSHICVHDAARPFINAAMVQSIIDEAALHGAACAAVPMKSTIKKSHAGQFVQQTLDRNSLWEIQTPQVVLKEVLEAGFNKAANEGLTVTDDVSLAEIQQKQVKLVHASYNNIKITTPDDMALAELIIGKQHGEL